MQKSRFIAGFLSKKEYAASAEQLESVEPAHRALAKLGIALEHLVALDALVVADGDAGAVDETDAGALAEAEQLEEHGHISVDGYLGSGFCVL